MWPRVVVVMLACWLAASPFIFGHLPHDRVSMLIDFGSAVALATFALLSFWPPTERAHVFNLPVGGGLILAGFLRSSATSVPAAAQNHIMLGLLVLMLAILPSRSNLPPRRWRELLART